MRGRNIRNPNALFLSRLRSEKKCSENTIPPTQPEFTSSKSTKKTPEQCMIYVQSFK